MKMTEQELLKIEASAENSDYHSDISYDQVKALIAEVRRLQAELDDTEEGSLRAQRQRREVK